MGEALTYFIAAFIILTVISLIGAALKWIVERFLQ